MKSLIKAIRDYQTKNDLSDYQLAPILNISPSALWRIKNGERSPNVDTLRAIALNIPSLKAYVANYVINGDKPGPRRPGRPTWKEGLEKAGVNLEGGIAPVPATPAFSLSKDPIESVTP